MARARSEGAQAVATGSFVVFAVAVVALWVVTIVSILRSSYTWGIKALALLATLPVRQFPRVVPVGEEAAARVRGTLTGAASGWADSPAVG